MSVPHEKLVFLLRLSQRQKELFNFSSVVRFDFPLSVSDFVRSARTQHGKYRQRGGKSKKRENEIIQKLQKAYVKVND